MTIYLCHHDTKVIEKCPNAISNDTKTHGEKDIVKKMALSSSLNLVRRHCCYSSTCTVKDMNVPSKENDVEEESDAKMIEQRIALARQRSEQTRHLLVKVLREQAPTQSTQETQNLHDQSIASTLHVLQCPKDLRTSLESDSPLHGSQDSDFQQQTSLPSNDTSPSFTSTSLGKKMTNTPIRAISDVNKKGVGTVEPSTSSGASCDFCWTKKDIKTPPVAYGRLSPLEYDAASYHQFPGTPLSEASAPTLLQREKATEEHDSSQRTCEPNKNIGSFDDTRLSRATSSICPPFPSVGAISRNEYPIQNQSNFVPTGKRKFDEEDSSTTFPVSAFEDSRENIPVTKSVSSSLIHHACKRHSQSASVVASVLRVDPRGASRRLPRTRADFLRRRRQSEFDFPINIALRNKASLPALKLLAEASPGVLIEGDGPEWGCALSCSLYERRGTDVASLLLDANPDQVRVRDRHLNYPIHVACLCGASLSVVELLASSYRRALRKANFHGQTPLDIATRNTLCGDEVVRFLQKASHRSLEDTAASLNDMLIRECSASVLKKRRRALDGL